MIKLTGILFNNPQKRTLLKSSFSYLDKDLDDNKFLQVDVDTRQRSFNVARVWSVKYIF